jgi:Domain of unknown function (DUF1833)
MRTLSANALRSAFAQQTDEVWLVLLTIHHPGLADDIRLVNDNSGLTSNGEVFVPFAFKLELPAEDPDNPGEARLTVDNIDRTIVTAMRSLSTPPEVTIQVILASDPDMIEAEFAGMVLRDVKWDAQSVSGVLRYEDITTEPVAVQMTPQRFPGLF